MINVAEFKDKHKGEEAFILGNAASLLDHKEFLDSLPGWQKVGLNSSNAHIESDYHVLVDSAAGLRYSRHPNKPKFVFHTPGGLQAEVKPDESTRVYLNPKVICPVAWSDDLSRYVHVCKATIWVALQLVKYMGFRYAYLMGFELSGKRIGGHIHDQAEFLDENAAQQLQLMGYLRGMIDGGKFGNPQNPDFKVFSTSTTSRCRVFPYISIPNRDIQRDFLYQGKPPDVTFCWDY